MGTLDQIAALATRLNINARTIAAQELLIKKLESELAGMTSDRDRLDRQVVGLQKTLQILGTDNNTRYDAANREVLRLRELCKTNGIDLGD